MALAVVASGTLTADGTEQDIATSTAAKTFVLEVNTSAMTGSSAAPDITELRIYTKVLTTGVEQLTYGPVVYQGGLISSFNIQSPPVPAPYSYRATLKQVGGTNRAYPYQVLSLD